MAHFAEINDSNTVVRVIVVADEHAPNEAAGANWCKNFLGGTWLQTSYNTLAGEHLLGGTPFRKNFAGVSGHYDAGRDAFYGPPDYPSWVLDESTCQWEAPYPCPDVDDTGNMYFWDEDAYQADNSTGWQIYNPSE